MQDFDVEDLNDRTEEKTEGQSERDGAGSGLFAEIMSWVVPIVIAVGVTLFIKSFIIINADIPTGSMENTIMAGDRVFGNRLAYLTSDPQRGDIIFFRYPDNEDDIYVKRIIGLPGETVTIEDGCVYIDGAGEPLAEDYLKEEWTVATGPYEFVVPEDSYFVMGDNRNDSWDSRYWTNTYVSGKKILGKAVLAYWPLSDFGKLE